jgi:hypothetical protein
MLEDKAPVWDAKAIARIAQDSYGGLRQMFEAHGWSERDASMMPAQQKRDAETYGGVEAFLEKHKA